MKYIRDVQSVVGCSSQVSFAEVLADPFQDFRRVLSEGILTIMACPSRSSLLFNYLLSINMVRAGGL